MGSPTLAAARPWSARSAGSLGDGEVRLWALPLDVPADVARPFLDDAELARAAGYRRPADGARFAASRAGLRRIAAGYLGADPARLCFAAGPAGRPAVAVHALARPHAAADGCQRVPGFEFSLSRTEDLALIAVSTTAVGADVERIRPRHGLADLVATRFPPREAACLAAGCALPAGPGDGALRGFYRHWTAREAYLKAVGCGLAGLRRVEVCCGSRPAIWVDGVLADGWQLSYVPVSPAHAAAVVARHPVTSCQWLPA